MIREISLVSCVKTKRDEPATPENLHNHEQTFGEDALFAYAERSDLNASHKRKEIETDLIGAYYLEVGEAPLAQFGNRENIPP